jgi:thioredoxin-dependent peroxiredoxin
MSLSKGQKAPIFKVNDIWGNEIDLQNTKGQTTLLSFFRFADCPMCNMRVGEIMRNKQLLTDKNIRVIAIFESPTESIKASIVDRHRFDFTIISDPSKTLYKRYEVQPSWWKMMKSMGFAGMKKMIQAKKQGFNLMGNIDGEMHQIPADFLIDKNGIITVAYYGNDIADHLALEEIL